MSVEQRVVLSVAHSMAPGPHSPTPSQGCPSGKASSTVPLQLLSRPSQRSLTAAESLPPASVEQRVESAPAPALAVASLHEPVRSHLAPRVLLIPLPIFVSLLDGVAAADVVRAARVARATAPQAPRAALADALACAAHREVFVALPVAVVV